MSTTYPLLRGFSPSDVIGWEHNAPVSAGQFCAAAVALAASLPRKRFVINLCNDRLNFMRGFAAALIADQVSLLPQSRSAATLHELFASHPDSYCLADDSDLPGGLPAIVLPPWGPSTQDSIPEIPGEQTAITAFTSGTTGRSQPHSRSWRSYVTAAELLNRRLGVPAHSRACVIGTVPPQHMFGFETTVMFPLQNGLSVHGARPLLPADLAAALEEMPGKRWLMTTPVHLRACVSAGTPLPPIAGVISATMPLSAELAAEAERAWSTQMHEIYGTTETGVVAMRRTAHTTAWRPNEGIALSQKGEDAWAVGGQLFQPVRLPDRVALLDDGEFELLGRPQDMVKVAGKRASLEALNHELLRVPGVRDGVFFLPDHAVGAKQRLAAVVVAPGATESAILRALRERLDPAFLPRPLLIVDALPRNATGKLPREALNALAATAKPRRA